MYMIHDMNCYVPEAVQTTLSQIWLTYHFLNRAF